MSTGKVFLVCSGLGTTRRGYEIFFESLFDKVRSNEQVDAHLFKGGGARAPQQTRLWNLPRRSKLAEALGNWLKVGSVSLGRGYYIEQATFFLSLIPYLLWHRPGVVYFSDKDLGNLLARWKNLSRQKYTLIFRNGGPYPPPYPDFDVVQQLTKPMHDQALEQACPPSQQHLLPAGFDLRSAFSPVEEQDKRMLRSELGLPTGKPVVLCVSAINRSHKRLDYVISEIAKLPEPRPYLMVLGQADAETPEIVDLGNKLLGENHIGFDNVSPDRLERFYQAADLFVLGSVREGFGRVMVEAMAWGLPCVVHDYAISRYVLGQYGHYGNFHEADALQQLIAAVMQTTDREDLARERHRWVYERFSWDRLLPAYVNMLTASARTK